MSYIKRKVLRLIGLLFTILDYFIPKDNSLWIFTCQRGVQYSDNTRLLFLEAVNHTNITCKMSTISYETGKIVSSEVGSNSVLYLNTIRGFYLLLKTKAVFISHGLGDLWIYKPSRKKIIIQVWHGIPLKRIGMLDKKNSVKQKKKFKEETKKYNMIICSSDIDAYTCSSCFGVPIEKMAITGLPRNAYLVQINRKLSKDISDNFEFLKKKVILYAPTFRDVGETQFFPFDDFSIEVIEDFLERNDAYLLVRGHVNDTLWKKNGKTTSSFNTDRIISMNQDKVKEVQDLLPYVDVLVTDYSSIYIDFLLLDRPVSFIPYDLEEYRETRGLLYDYELVTPGPKIHSQAEFLSEIQTAFDVPERYAEKRAFVRSMFHTFNDNNSAERIFTRVRELIDQ